VTSVHRNNRHLVSVVLGGTSNGQRDARMRQLIEENIMRASIERTAPAIVENPDLEKNATYSLSSSKSEPTATAPMEAPPTPAGDADVVSGAAKPAVLDPPPPPAAEPASTLSTAGAP
jgi:D-alanyl-D-alanine carboxypeptidase